MIDLIKNFIDSKNLSKNSRTAYSYDLQQFLDIVGNKISKERLALYEQSLSSLKLSAKKRKLSTINQFLYFLYENGYLNVFYRLTNKEKISSTVVNRDLLDISLFYQKSQQKEGQVIALLMIELGLTPSEIKNLKLADIDLSFDIIKVKKDGLLRVLEIPQKLLPYLEEQRSREADSIYLFDKKGATYSRQWFFNQLKGFLASQGLSDLSAQAIRQQYILHQKQAGKSLLELSNNLGLKSPLTIEKYYK